MKKRCAVTLELQTDRASCLSSGTLLPAMTRKIGVRCSLRLLGYVEFALCQAVFIILGVLSVVFQIVTLAYTEDQGQLAQIGTGIWCGIFVSCLFVLPLLKTYMTLL